MAAKKRCFVCPRCGYSDNTFHQVCPECGRPYFRDYIDSRINPRDPNPQCVYKGKTWARIFLTLTPISLGVGLLFSFHII